MPRGSYKRKPLLHRFMKNISPLPSPTGCRLWVGYTNRQGYGRFWFEGRFHQAHAMTATAFYGPIPDGMVTCHRCDNPPCVNPAHLFFGTYGDNARDTVAKGRHAYQRDIDLHYRKLSKPMVIAIKSSDLPNGELAKRYGVSPGTICDIQHGRTWKHLSGAGA